MVRPNGESAPWMVLVNSRWTMPCGLSFCRAMLAVTAVSAIFRRSGSKAGLRSTSAKASMTAGASAFRALIDADAESALMLALDRRGARLEELVERIRLARRRAAAAQHRADQAGEPGLLGRLEQRSGADARGDVDERQLVVLDDHHHHAVRQHEAGRLRRLERRQRRIGDLGRLGDLRQRQAGRPPRGPARRPRAGWRSGAGGSSRGSRGRERSPWRSRSSRPCGWRRRRSPPAALRMSALVTASRRST